jgi:putative PEP-CTERM system histidine kinase
MSGAIQPGWDAMSLIATLAGAVFVVLGIWSVGRDGASMRQRFALAAALVATGLWAGFAGIFPAASAASAILETLRDAGWLAYMWLVSSALGKEHFPRAVRLVYKIVAILIASLALIQLCDLAGLVAVARVALVQSLYANVSLIVAVGLLVLVHNIYCILSPAARHGMGSTLAALTALWAYDLNLYALGILGGSPASDLIALRPALSILLVPLFVLARRQGQGLRLTVSRRVAFQSLSLVAIGIYLAAMALTANVMRSLGGNFGRVAQQVVLVGALAGLLLLIASPGFRAWLRVMVSKHFFRHRYDYRSEWMRFTETVGHPGANNGSLETRVVKALADITGSPGGALMLPDANLTLGLEQTWQWHDFSAPHDIVPAAVAEYLQSSERVIEFDVVRHSPASERSTIPGWMLASPAIWVGVPLVHFGRLVGLVVLARPAHARALDWEDFDLLKTVGGQVASYLSEAQSQYALSEARRFDEFNRRFAFIMHDIKNAVSQLSLLARNVERHADNPAFRQDMVETLNISAARLNSLLARLSQHHKGKASQPVRLSLRTVVDAIVAQKGALHPVLVGHDCAIDGYADRDCVEQIVGHLVQNAIDASEPGVPVRIAIREIGQSVAIDIIDHGCGMSPEFVRDELFKAFSSTKQGGFGIGAFEARALAQSMNGRIEVHSRPGHGSRFTLWLPKADVAASDRSLPARGTDRTAA